MQDTVDTKDPYMSLIDVIARLINLKQQDGESLTTYLGRLRHQADMVKAHLGSG